MLFAMPDSTRMPGTEALQRPAKTKTSTEALAVVVSWHASQHVPASPAGASAPSAKSKTYARSQSRVAAPPSRWSAPKLSEQLVRQHALKNTIIVAFSNKNHLDYTFNWINYVRVSTRDPLWVLIVSPWWQ